MTHFHHGPDDDDEPGVPWREVLHDVAFLLLGVIATVAVVYLCVVLIGLIR